MKKISIILSLAALLLFSSISSCFAASSYPNVFDLYETDYGVHIVYDLPDGRLTARVISVNSQEEVNQIYFVLGTEFSGAHNGTLGICSANVVTVKQYILNNGKWSLVSYSNLGGGNYTGEVFEDINLNHKATIYESTKDVVYDTDWAQVFFPQTLPLLVTTMKLVAVETPIVGAEVLKTMKIILLCGVGCLALLITLPLLARVLRRFLAR